jgi:predicted acyltransferase
MFCLIAEGFGFSSFIGSAWLGPIARQFTHQPWEGMNAWDLVQPFFMFIVGAVMPASFARRWAAGETWQASLQHVLHRCALLILWGLIARSIQAGRPVLDLINVLAQIAFTYFVAFLVLRKSWKVQGLTAFGMLVAHWALYQFASAPGVAGPWVRDANIGCYLDQLILRKNWSGSYATINCLSSAANTLFGVMAGELLLSALPAGRKTRILALTGLGSIALGLLLSPVIPIIKKIWTASFAFYSTGFTLLALLLFYWICDVKRRTGWMKLFLIVGSNSIFIYLVNEVLRNWMEASAKVFTGWVIQMWEPGGEFLTAWVVLLFQVYVCYWLYQRKIFFKL